jgi:hypothetical protein
MSVSLSLFTVTSLRWSLCHCHRAHTHTRTYGKITMVSVPAGARSQYFDHVAPPLGFPPSEKKYAYPRESDQTIVEELDKIGVTEIRTQDLDHPNQQIVLTCFSAFLEDLCYVDESVVKSIKEYNLQKDVTDHVVSGAAAVCGLEYI